ncbi:MAG: AAA family ATPase [Microthrixaceae bacterium]
MAVFPSASGAVIAAIDMQRSLHQQFAHLQMRIGLAVGDVVDEGGGLSGLAVVAAERLARCAQAGQIVVDRAVRWLGLEHSDATFERLEPFELLEPFEPLDVGGAIEPVVAFVVPWRDSALLPGRRPPFPPGLTTASDLGFVGRSVQWVALEGIWRRAASGVTQIVVLGGEAGAGKTRLAAEFARSRFDDGATVLLGSCDPQTVAAYQPWVEVLDQLPRQVHADDAARAVDLVGAVEAALSEAAHRSPVVLVIEDLHWAGDETLTLLAHLARVAGLGPIMVIATFRETRDGTTHPVTNMLTDVRRMSSVTRLRVEGLDAEDVTALVALATGELPGPALCRIAASIAEHSRGNAFFVGELWRRALENGVVHIVDGSWQVDEQLARHYAVASQSPHRDRHEGADPCGLPHGLSNRELQVLRLAAEGYSNGAIGRRLCISANTAGNHVRSILRKTGTANRAEAATYAALHGLLEDWKKRDA